ncbi:hypothetical protein N431DRAFT_484603 [Stipitochalara longipes BDJ]|nr:hypothetical protein N431DRAFT_484603 [Stipitochalara longipes BDJ]
MSPLGGREMLDPLARLGRGSPYGIMRGGGLGMGGLSVRGLGVGGLRAGMLGERSLGIQGRELHPGALLGNRGGLGMGIHGDPLSQALQLGRYQGGLQHRHGRHGGLGDLGLMPYRSYLGGGWPHGAECDTCLREQLYHRHQGHYDHGCGCRRSCGESLNSNTKSNFDFKTKDVTVRGKARAVRASYLTEAGKFEADLVKFMDKKSEEEVPDRVVDMLVSFINREEYSNGDLVDEVRLNILASSVGAKSLVEYSLGQLKHSQLPLDGRIICEIITLITQSTKVDDGLRKWLEKELKADGDYLYLQLLNHSAAFEKLWRDRPEAVAEVQRMSNKPSCTSAFWRSLQ